MLHTSPLLTGLPERGAVPAETWYHGSQSWLALAWLTTLTGDLPCDSSGTTELDPHQEQRAGVLYDYIGELVRWDGSPGPAMSCTCYILD